MGVIGEILQRVRQTGQTGAEPPTRDATLAALARLDEERADCRQRIADHAIQRRELLLEDGTDGAINRLDVALDRATLTLERLDALEQELIRTLSDQDAAARQDAAEKLLTAHWRAVERFVAAARTATERRLDLADSRAAAEQAGLHHLVQRMDVPTIPQLSRDWLDNFERGCKATLSGGLSATPAPAIFEVFFPQRYGMYRPGEVAGFSHEIAHALVKSGAAKWRPGQRLPAPEQGGAHD